MTNQFFGSPWLSVCGDRLPLAVSREGRVLAKDVQGKGPPVAVISIPKAGTYLVAKLLECLGSVDSELHVAPTAVSDYRGLSTYQKRTKPPESAINLPIELTARLVGDGQFMVGHLPVSEPVKYALQQHRKIFLRRELAEATLSHMRFLEASGRAGKESWQDEKNGPARFRHFLHRHGVGLFEYTYKPMLGWINEPDVLVMSFEDIIGDNGAEAQLTAVEALCAHIGLQTDGAGDILREQVLGKDTKTLSSGRTLVSQYWDEEVSGILRALGIDDMNAALGYSQSIAR